MSEVKTFRVNGEILKPGNKMNFTKDVKALKQDQAVEAVYLHFGGQHKIKRVHIKVISIKEMENEDVKQNLN